jgi:hypothetical protein
LHVPQIYAIGENELTYIQEDLGNWMLLDVVESERRERSLSSRVMTLYQKALKRIVGNRPSIRQPRELTEY